MSKHSREDKRRWTLAGDSKAEVTSGPPIVRGVEVRVIPEAEADRQLVEERDRLREVLRAVLMEPDPIKRNQLVAPVLPQLGGVTYRGQ
jgi:hypothetical protein